MPVGLVDCAAHPAVLLFAWVAPGVRASLREGTVTQALDRATVPAALRLPSGVLLYGPQTRAATLIEPGAASESLSAPPRHRSCHNATPGGVGSEPPGHLNDAGPRSAPGPARESVVALLGG
jgi:hypothetical protein